MSWRKDNRRRKQVERPFARRLKYESAKEGLGKLVEWGGAGVGMLVGLAGARWGLPVSPAVASTSGAIIGGMVGSQGKAFVVAGIDHLRERRDQRRSAASSVEGRRRRHQHSSGSPPGSRARGDSAGIVGQVIGGLDNVRGRLDRTSRQLDAIHRKVWASQDEISVILAGGRPEVTSTVEGQLTATRNLLRDLAGELRLCVKTLKAYRVEL
ncbi:hypothetical protein [Micromonospora lutea]|uniref:Uncharacterized protein n=1 Tax=Micromonospora lutea TaxID=419825 RepID=A0ABQ4IY01_9ACTN|nr:hypothetical protein [Micromonospora lutea]GIJ22786.1 hypothetical protein Vlu01_34100 [Micromonospora lutea]